MDALTAGMTKIGSASYVLSGTGTWVLYCRVSTTLQAEEGVSMEAQRSQLLARMRERGGSLRALCMDFGLSAKTTERPALQHGMGLCRRGDTFCVLDISRLSRDVADAMTIQKDLRARRVELVVLDLADISSSTGRAMYGIKSIFNQLEREGTAFKTSQTMKTRIAEGKLNPRPPYGYKSSSPRAPHEPVPEEQRTIEYLRTRREADPLVPCAVLAEELETLGFPKRKAKRWRCDAVQDILLRHGIPCATEREARGTMWKPEAPVPPSV